MTDVRLVTSADSELDQRRAAADEEWGQRVLAAYVGTADTAELTAWIRARLAPAERPKSLHRLDELPRTSTGKVRRLDLPEVLGLDGG